MTVANFNGSGFAPTANTAFENDTTQSLVTGGQIDVGDSFEVSYTVTIDPDLGDVSDHLVNQAVANGTAIDANGNQLFDAQGNLLAASDVSDNGVDPNGENGEDNGDGTFGNDPTPVVIADLGIAKSIVGDVELVNGVYQVRFSATVENTGTIDLDNLSLVEDLAAQFGSVFSQARDLTLTTSTSNPSSQINLSSTFNGSSDTELLDQSAINTLHVGDYFTVEFVVELDAAAAGQTLENQIVGYGEAIDEQGNPIQDSTGNVLTAHDFSDSGVNPNNANTGDPGDTGTTDDDTIINIPTAIVDDGDDGTTSGSPANLLALPRFISQPISNFIGAPGPIYSGIPTNTANPVTLESNRPITGGYTGDGSASSGSIQQVDCCGEQIVDAIPGQPVPVEMHPVDTIQGDMIQGDGQIIQEIPMDDCGCGEVIAEPCGQCQAPIEECGCSAGPVQGEIIHDPMPVHQQLNPSFLRRMRGWLSR